MEQLIKFLALCKTITLSLTLWFLILPWLPVFSIYRNIVDTILKIKHGKKYGGLFDRSDCFSFAPDVTKCSMTGIFYVKSDLEIDLFKEMKEVFQEKVFNDPSAYPKLTSTKHDFGGYPYWLKNGVSLDDTVKPLEVPQNGVFTEECLKELTGELSMRKYPRNETVLWEFYISERSLENKNGSIGYRYPVIFRVHHSISDGTSLMALFIRLFGDESSKNYSEELFKTLFKGNADEKSKRSTREVIKRSLVKFIKTVRFWIEFVFVAPGRMLEGNQLKSWDRNALHNVPCSGEKIVVWTAEDRVESIPLIKKIRRQTNSKFMSVVCTAISASMTNYFKRHRQSHPIPDYTSGDILQVLKFPSIDPSKPVKLENKFTMCPVELPTITQPNVLIETLKKIDETMKQEENYSNSLIVRLFVSFIYGIIPVKLGAVTLGYNSHTFLISNIPGGSKINILHGCVFQNVIGVAPSVKGIGIAFTLLSYDNRLQIAIMVDKAVTESQKEVQRIADDILYYIKIMDTEVRKIYGE